MKWHVRRFREVVAVANTRREALGESFNPAWGMDIVTYHHLDLLDHSVAGWAPITYGHWTIEPVKEP